MRIGQGRSLSGKQLRLQKKTSSVHRCKLFTLLVSDCPDSKAKLGIIATKKTGSAVVRNKIKRRLRHAFSSVLKNFRNKNFCLIIVAKSNCFSCAFSFVRAQLEVCLRKAIHLTATPVTC